MSGLIGLQTKNKVAFIAACLIMLSMAFIQCYKTTHDLQWTYSPDFDRDMAFIQGTLDGHIGKDPNYLGEYIWYNPLLFSIETIIVKVSGLPANVIVTRAGTYLNLLGPIAFIFMLLVLFDYKVALTSLLSYLFLASGNIFCWGAATYSPWLYPVCFNQFLFYINIILCYWAFSKQKLMSFAILGAFIGISFLGHAAPSILVGLIVISIHGGNTFKVLSLGDYRALKKYLLQGVVMLACFILMAFPFLFIIVGKYHLHIVNRAVFEFTMGIFSVYNYLDLIRENISVSFLIALIGFIWFYKNFHQTLIRRIILNWLFISILMYIYATVIPKIDHLLDIRLPGTVTSFHYFFYLKALQSVFFGFGFVFIVKRLFQWIENSFNNRIGRTSRMIYEGGYLFMVAVLLCAIIYFPYYRNRRDFVQFRELALIKANDKNKIQVYNYIVKNIPPDKVILCEFELSIFPVMATGRKMVSINATFSNPYVSYEKRESDRNNMFLYLKTGQPDTARKLFCDYQVSFALLSNKELRNYKAPSPELRQIVFENNEYTLFALKD